MRICLVCISNGWGGGESVVYELAYHLKRKGYHICLAINDELIKYYQEQKDLRIFNLGKAFPFHQRIEGKLYKNKNRYIRGIRYIFNRFMDEISFFRLIRRNSKKFIQFLQENKIDIIHSHMQKAAILLDLIPKLEKIRVHTLHGEPELLDDKPDHFLIKILNKIEKSKYKTALSNMDQIIGVSNFIIKYWESKKVQFKKEPVVIYNGINYLYMRNYEQELKNLNGDFNLLFPGGAKWVKGGDILIRALALIKERIPGLHLYIALDVPENNVLRNLVKVLKLEPNVTFTGFLKKDEYYKLLKSVDVFILPSRYEALPISILEAMAMGKPVIASSRGGIPEIVVENHNGILVEPCPERIADAIYTIYINKSMREKISMTNVMESERYDWNNSIEAHIELYKKLI